MQNESEELIIGSISRSNILDLLRTWLRLGFEAMSAPPIQTIAIDLNVLNPSKIEISLTNILASNLDHGWLNHGQFFCLIRPAIQFYKIGFPFSVSDHFANRIKMCQTLIGAQNVHEGKNFQNQTELFSKQMSNDSFPCFLTQAAIKMSLNMQINK